MVKISSAKVWQKITQQVNANCSALKTNAMVTKGRVQLKVLVVFTTKQGSRKSEIGWELAKSGFHVRCQNHYKIYILVVFPLFISFNVVLCISFGLLDKFGWRYIFPVAQFGQQTIIVPFPKVANKSYLLNLM